MSSIRQVVIASGETISRTQKLLFADAVKTLTQPEVGITIASKLLMVKRPWLVPMFDSRLQEAFNGNV